MTSQVAESLAFWWYLRHGSMHGGPFCTDSANVVWYKRKWPEHSIVMPTHLRLEAETELGADGRDGIAPHKGAMGEGPRDDESRRRRHPSRCGRCGPTRLRTIKRKKASALHPCAKKSSKITLHGRSSWAWFVAPRAERLHRVLPGVVRREPRRTRSLSHTVAKVEAAFIYTEKRVQGLAAVVLKARGGQVGSRSRSGRQRGGA